MTLTYRLSRGLLRLALGFYYSEFEVHGREHIPLRGPLLILANHHIALVDPFLLVAASDRPIRFIAKSTLFKIPVLSFFMRRAGCIPVYRTQDPGYSKEKNETLYGVVRDALQAGEAIGIFPEGRSHTDPALGELKHGAAKMALEAEEAGNFALGLRIQIAGIHFERTRLFRGKVLLTFTPPITLESHRESFADDPRSTIENVTHDFHNRLSKLVLDVENYELVRLAERVEGFGLLEERERGLKGKLAREKLVVSEYKRLRAIYPNEVRKVLRLLKQYDRILRHFGGRDDLFAITSRWTLTVSIAKNVLFLALGAPFLAIGVLMNAAPFWMVRLLSATSAFLVDRSQDVRACVGLLLAICVFPIWYALLGVAGWLFLPLWIWMPLLIAGPTCGILAIRWLEQWRNLGHETSALGLSLGSPATRRRLQKLRSEILEKIARLAALGRVSERS